MATWQWRMQMETQSDCVGILRNMAGTVVRDAPLLPNDNLQFAASRMNSIHDAAWMCRYVANRETLFTTLDVAAVLFLRRLPGDLESSFALDGPRCGRLSPCDDWFEVEVHFQRRHGFLVPRRQVGIFGVLVKLERYVNLR
jgi:hypothetical protein